MPPALIIEPVDEFARAYIAKHPLEFCRPLSPKKSEPADGIEKEPFAEADEVHDKEESIEKCKVEVSAEAGPQMRDNASQQISNDGLGLTGAMGSFSLVPRTTKTTNATTTNGLTGAMGSFSLAPKPALSTDSKLAAASASSTRSPPPNYEEGVKFEVPFGNWCSFKWNPDSVPKPIKFDLIPNNGYRPHNEETTKEDLLELFRTANATHSLIETKTHKDSFFLRYKIPGIHRFQMAHAVYCSNFIESVGPSEAITTSLALMVFTGQKVLDIPTEYEEKEHLSILTLEEKEKGLTMKDVVLSRREVIQHSKALRYILDAVVNHDYPLTEELILRTHEILVTGLDIHNAEGQRTHAWQSYAGRYRHDSEHVSVNTTNFLAPSKVAVAMKKLFAEFEAELREAEKKRQVDPIFLAAKYCQEFVMINPFLDGNSRTYRLILNAILMKYMGVVIGIGGNEDERAHYLGICRRAGEEMGDPGELASLVLEKVKERLEKMDSSLGCLEGDGGGWSIQV